MERAKILKLFLQKGHQLDSNSLDFFTNNPNKIKIFLKTIEGTEGIPDIITHGFVKSLLKDRPRIEVIRSSERERKTSTVQEHIRHFINRYEKLKEVLVKKPELTKLVSINKLPQRKKEFSLIGMVRQKNEGSIILEDSTGELTIHFENMKKELDKIVGDEVLGMVCERNGMVKAKKIIWPDIPLKRKINKTKNETYCLFLSDIHMDDPKFNKKSYAKFLEWINTIDYPNFYIFVLGGISKKKEGVVNFFNDLPKKSFKIFMRDETDPGVDIADLNLFTPSLVKIEDSVVMFLCHGSFLGNYVNIWKDSSLEAVMVDLLKKRHMNPTFDFNKKIYEDDPFLLDIIPDIVAFGHFHSPSFLNYKGTTIISTGSFISKPIYWVINLETRETIKMDFT